MVVLKSLHTPVVVMYIFVPYIKVKNISVVQMAVLKSLHTPVVVLYIFVPYIKVKNISVV